MTGLTLTCKCGRSEFFEGGLLESIEKMSQSSTWRYDARGFVVCSACREVSPTVEVAE